MEASSSPRPARRRAHVCRACNSAFTCKAELLEHEQDMHSSISGKRKPSLGHVTSVEAAEPMMKVHLLGKSAVENTAGSQTGGVQVSMSVDHEEVHESSSGNTAGSVPGQRSPAGTGTHVKRSSSKESHLGVMASASYSSSVRQQTFILGEGVVGTAVEKLVRAADQNIGSSDRGQAKIIVKPACGTSQASDGDVIKAVGLQRKEAEVNVPFDGTKVVGIASTSESGFYVRGGLQGAGMSSGVSRHRSPAMKSALISTSLSQQEAAEYVGRLHEIGSCPSTLDNEELQLLAAVSSTRTPDVIREPPAQNPVPISHIQQLVGEVMASHPSEMVEQEVVLETTEVLPDTKPPVRRAFGRQMKKGDASSMCLVQLPMTPHQFAAADGGRKHMVAITVAPAPRMVSVLLRNRGMDGAEVNHETVGDMNVEPSAVQPSTHEQNFSEHTPAIDVTPMEVATAVKSDSSTADNGTGDEAAAAAESISTEPADTEVKTDMEQGVAVPTVHEDQQDMSEYSEKRTDRTEEINEQQTEVSHCCGVCGRRFRQLANLRKHVRINHENIKPHVCTVCQKAFPYASYLAEHMAIHDDSADAQERKFACEHCSKTFMRVSGLRKHIKVEHLEGPKPYVCPHCQQDFAYRCTLVGHMRKHSVARPFACGVCPATFKHVSNLQKHVKTLHPEPCGECGDETSSCDHTVHRITSKLRYQCMVCSRMFESAASLHIHERVHTGEKPEVCEICGRGFQHQSNLKKHMLKHSGRRPHVCSQCPRAFYARHSLLAHMRKHTGDSPYQCEICQKRFCTKNSLQVHMNLHADIRPYACDTCGRQFAQLGNLQKHMSVHTGERPHTCSKCARSFADISALRRHLSAIHDRDARYACETCGKRFVHLSSVRAHRLMHSGEKPYRCSVCNKAFAHRSGCLRHSRIHQHDGSGAVAGGGVLKAVVGGDSNEVMLKPGEYIVYLTE